MEQGLRYNEGKLEWSLVDFPSFESMVKVLMYGKKKYTTKDCSGAHNWKKGEWTNEIIESLLRHTFALLNGELIDPESKESHIGHAQCNLMFLDWMLRNKPEFDTLNLLKNERQNDKLPFRFFAGECADISSESAASGNMEGKISPI